MPTFTLSPEEIQSLRKIHRKQKRKRDAYRINAIILLGSGWTQEEVSQALLLDDATLRNYVKAYQSGGVKSLLKTNYAGKQPKLSTQQLKALSAHIEKSLYLKVEDIIRYVKKTYGEIYTISGLTDLLHRLGFVYKKPKVVPGKANLEAQKEFVEYYHTLRENTSKLAQPVYFMDGCHPQHNTVAAYGWIKKGVDKEIKSNTGRQRININGLINIDTLNTLVRMEDSVNAQSTIALFKSLEKKHRKAEKIHVIFDNAAYYRAKILKAYLATSKIEILYLPPYSPNLNLIERLWKFFRKTVLYNRYYEKFKDFKEACEYFFQDIKTYRKELKSLLRENFQLIGVNT